MSDESNYKLVANLGTSQNPFFIEMVLGVFSGPSEALFHAERALENCQVFLTWVLFENDKNLHTKIESKRIHAGGCSYQILISADSIDDARDALNEVSVKLDCVEGFDTNESSSYQFVRSGEFISDDELSYDSNVLDIGSRNQKA